MYHYVRNCDAHGYKLNSLDFNLFNQQIEYLSKNYHILSLDELQDLMSSKTPINPKKPYVTLTFDDGFIDHYQNVFKILTKYNCKAIFFPITENIGNNIVSDVHKIQLIIAKNKNIDFLLNEIISSNSVWKETALEIIK